MPALERGAAIVRTSGAPRGRRPVAILARLVIGAVAMATALATAARFHWIADLATHFPLQYAAAALLAGLAALWARTLGWALLALALVAFNGYGMLRPRADVPAPEIASRPLRLLVANVFHGNSEYHRVIAHARTSRADAAVFVEVTPQWREALRALESELPYVSAMTARRHGVLVMSRFPLLESEWIVLAPGGEPFMRTRLGVKGSPVELIAVHAAWPAGPENSRIRNQELAALAAMALSAPKPFVIAGDLNISPHSPHFRALLAGGGLRSASAARRWAPTWPTFFLPAGIQIDHVLLSGPIAVRRFETGSAVGSDHLPLVVDLVL